jgi:hypothetical protein
MTSLFYFKQEESDEGKSSPLSLALSRRGRENKNHNRIVKKPLIKLSLPFEKSLPRTPVPYSIRDDTGEIKRDFITLL